DVEQLQAVAEQARVLLDSWDQPAAEIDRAARREAKAARRAPRAIPEYTGEVRARLDALARLVIPRLLKGNRLTGLRLLLGLASVFPLGWLAAGFLVKQGPSLGVLLVLGVAASTGVWGVIGLLAHAAVSSLARRRVAALYHPLCAALADADAAQEHFRAHYQAEHDRALREA